MGQKQQQNVHRTLAAACVVFVLVAGFRAIPVIQSLQQWDAGYRQPDIAARFIEAFLWGLMAFAAACGLNLKTVLSSFGVSLGSMTPTEKDSQ